MSEDYEAKARELVPSTDIAFDRLRTEIAAALREAVEAEREAAAQLCLALARQAGVLRSLKATHKSEAFKEAATVIRARGGK